MDDSETKRQQLAAAFDRDVDPLAEFEGTFDATDSDPIELFTTEVLATKPITPRTRRGYQRVINQWRTHMDAVGRHPACPTVRHLQKFIEWELDQKENHPDTVQEKLRKLEEMFNYWQTEPSLPHSQEFNPFEVIKHTVSFESEDKKKLPRIPLADLQAELAGISRLRDLAIVLVQLKLGLRASEACNLVVGEIDIDNPELTRHYPTLGEHWMLDERPNAMYIPHDRYGNKSGRPRVLPLDDETQCVLTRYLLIRPDSGEPWVFLSEKGNQLQHQNITDIWRNTFHPEYAETEHHRPVLSHYGRHRFTTYWRVQQDLPRPLVKYLRGDCPGSGSIDDRAGIDEYIHAYYEDVAECYREDIYELL